MKTCVIPFSAVLVVLSSLIGCGRPSPAGWGGHVVAWSQTTADAKPVAGLDEASVNFGTCGNESALVIWNDRGGSFGASWDKSRSAIHYEGRFVAQNGREYVVECFTADGMTGLVTIDGQDFKLEDGSLFLVATSGPKAIVKQLQGKLLKPEMKSLRALANGDTDIHSFFAELSTPPKPQTVIEP